MQQVITDALDLRGWLWSHNSDSRRSYGAGLPDLIAVDPRSGRLLFVEVKGPKTRVRPEQQQWIDALALGGADARIVRGADEAHALAAEILGRRR